MNATSGHHQSVMNPFESDIVRDPRSIDTPIESVNSTALDRLDKAFAKAETLKRERPPAVELVLSEPGFGKSHLLGRLFRRLAQRATLVYLTPFQDPESCWTQILEKVIQELSRPAQSDKMNLGPTDQSQLAVVTRKVLESLVGDLIVDGLLPAPQVPPQASMEEHTRVWNDWMNRHFEAMLTELDVRLTDKGVSSVSPSRKAWLKVLYAHSFPSSSYTRELCLDWLQGQPLDDDERKELGLRLSDIPTLDQSCAARNEASFKRLRDILQFTSFYRPFLFCVDQTELYQTSNELASTLGVVLSRLNRECANHLVVVTSNQEVWRGKLIEHFEEADRHVLSSLPIPLEGVDRQQAEALLDQRLGLANQEFSSGLSHFLDELFAARKRIGPREVLKEASHWWTDKPRAKRPLSEIFGEYREAMLQEESKTSYDTGVFQWAAEYILGPSVQATPKQIKTQKGYLTMRLDVQGSQCYFGFESGSHWRRWQAILEETERFCNQAEHEQQQARAVFFRTPDQRPLPDRNMQVIKNSPFVTLFNLTQEEAADFYAARDMYVDILQGDYPGISQDELQPFLNEYFSGWAQRIGKQTSEPEPMESSEQQLNVALIDAVKRFHMLNMTDMVELLAQQGMTSKEESITRLATDSKNIKVWQGPNSTVFTWIPSQ